MKIPQWYSADFQEKTISYYNQVDIYSINHFQEFSLIKFYNSTKCLKVKKMSYLTPELYSLYEQEIYIT